VASKANHLWRQGKPNPGLEGQEVTSAWGIAQLPGLYRSTTRALTPRAC